MDAIHGIGTNIGRYSKSGPGTLGSIGTDKARFWPDIDMGNVAITANDKVYVEIIHTVTESSGPRDMIAKLGCTTRYNYA